MKKSINNILKSVLVSLTTLIVGFVAISLPFNLFNTLTEKEMRIIFLCEIIIYSVMFALFFVVKERSEEKKKQKQKDKITREKRRIQLLKDLEEFNMVA